MAASCTPNARRTSTRTRTSGTCDCTGVPALGGPRQAPQQVLAWLQLNVGALFLIQRAKLLRLLLLRRRFHDNPPALQLTVFTSTESPRRRKHGQPRAHRWLEHLGGAIGTFHAPHVTATGFLARRSRRILAATLTALVNSVLGPSLAANARKGGSRTARRTGSHAQVLARRPNYAQGTLFNPVLSSRQAHTAGAVAQKRCARLCACICGQTLESKRTSVLLRVLPPEVVERVLHSEVVVLVEERSKRTPLVLDLCFAAHVCVCLWAFVCGSAEGMGD